MKKVKDLDIDKFMTQETQTIFNYVKYIAGGNNGGIIHYNDRCIHPLAFVGVKWDMNVMMNIDDHLFVMQWFRIM
jgi:hypothetical protein